VINDLQVVDVASMLCDGLHDAYVLFQERHFVVGEFGNIQVGTELPELVVAAIIYQSDQAFRCQKYGVSARCVRPL